MFEGVVLGQYRVDITFNGASIPKYFSEVNHSPDGFQWGYGGSGPAQAAYAILRTALALVIANPLELIFWTKNLYQQFKWDIIAKFPKDKPWKMTLEEVNTWIDRNKNNIAEEWENIKEIYGGD